MRGGPEPGISSETPWNLERDALEDRDPGAQVSKDHETLEPWCPGTLEPRRPGGTLEPWRPGAQASQGPGTQKKKINIF